MSNLTIGEQRVRTQFDPSQDSDVDQIKQKSAALINALLEIEVQAKELKELCYAQRNKDRRCANFADNQMEAVKKLISGLSDKVEEACMWAVKAATATAP